MADALEVLVIGAGFGGLGMGMRLKQAGRTNFVILEKEAGVGGTWWVNRYPGAACDIPSHLYSFSFAPRADWTRKYPEQAEIQAYLDDCVARAGLGAHLRLGTRVESLQWDPAARQWQVRAQSPDGEALSFSARAVVTATGSLSRPALPAIEGLEQFAGPVVHTAQWRPDLRLRDRRIGVIGNGASAVQLVPPLAQEASELLVFQRTPSWVLPRGDAPLGPRMQWLLQHVPGLRQAYRGLIYAQHELRFPGFLFPAGMRLLEPLMRGHLRRQVPPGKLRDALTPRYRVGCKRILLSDDFYPALQRPHVHLVTAGIERIVPQGVRTQDGMLHALDVLVAATGFHAADMATPFGIGGLGGRTLHHTWRHDPTAYLGTMVAGFPNLFILVGPNTVLGHNSMVHIIESQIAFVMDALRQMRERSLAALNVRADAQERYNRELQRRLAGTVWASGCHSWYRAADGRITTQWPGSTLEFRRRTRRVDLAAFDTVRA
jgi:cation diffusion facilitator CzcD-associated flavoprotein CzcO